MTCRRHPTYKAKRRPTADCTYCRTMWDNRVPPKVRQAKLRAIVTQAEEDIKGLSGHCLVVKKHHGYWHLIGREHNMAETTYTRLERLTEGEARFLVKEVEVEDLFGRFGR